MCSNIVLLLLYLYIFTFNTHCQITNKIQDFVNPVYYQISSQEPSYRNITRINNYTELTECLDTNSSVCVKVRRHEDLEKLKLQKWFEESFLKFLVKGSTVPSNKMKPGSFVAYDDSDSLNSSTMQIQNSTSTPLIEDQLTIEYDLSVATGYDTSLAGEYDDATVTGYDANHEINSGNRNNRELYMENESKMNPKKELYGFKEITKKAKLMKRANIGSNEIEYGKNHEKDNTVKKRIMRRRFKGGEADFVTELFRYIATLVETEGDDLAANEIGFTEGNYYNDVHYSNPVNSEEGGNRTRVVVDDQPTLQSSYPEFESKSMQSSTVKAETRKVSVFAVRPTKTPRGRSKPANSDFVPRIPKKIASLGSNKNRRDDSIASRESSSTISDPTYNDEITVNYLHFLANRGLNSKSETDNVIPRNYANDRRVRKNIATIDIDLRNGSFADRVNTFNSSFNDLPIIISIITNKEHYNHRRSLDPNLLNGNFTNDVIECCNKSQSKYLCGTLYHDYDLSSVLTSSSYAIKYNDFFICIYVLYSCYSLLKINYIKFKIR